MKKHLKNKRELMAGLSARQVAQYYELSEIVEAFGPFSPQGVGGLGYQGPATNGLGIVCGCCTFYEAPGECELSEQPVEMRGGCRLGINPSIMADPSMMNAGMPNRSAPRGGAESRSLPLAEVRVDKSSGVPVITGYAAVFNSMSEDLGGFREVIRPGAFASSLAGSDIRALVNHDKNLILGRLKAGTLKVSEDSRGLKYEITPPDTQYARDLMISIQRGDISGSSFRFYMSADASKGQTWRSEPTGVIREITQFEAVDDVSVVTYPAYSATDVAIRQLEAFRKSLPQRGLDPIHAALDLVSAE